MHPFLFTIGSFKLPMYGLMIAIGYIAAVYYLLQNNKYIGLAKEKLYDLVFYIILSGILGGKLFYTFTYWDSFGNSFSSKLLYVFKTFQYGFVFYGGLILSFFVFMLYTKKQNIPRLPTLDIFAPALALAHMFGRIGCFFAGCCYGKQTSSFLGVIFSDPNGEIPANLLGIPLHPVQLYEAFGNLVIFIFLNILLSKKIKQNKLHGTVFFIYMIFYGLLRFLLEFLRADNRGNGFFGLSPAQTISLLLVISGISAYKITRQKYGKH